MLSTGNSPPDPLSYCRVLLLQNHRLSVQLPVYLTLEKGISRCSLELAFANKLTRVVEHLAEGQQTSSKFASHHPNPTQAKGYLGLASMYHICLRIFAPSFRVLECLEAGQGFVLSRLTSTRRVGNGLKGSVTLLLCPILLLHLPSPTVTSAGRFQDRGISVCAVLVLKC